MPNAPVNTPNAPPTVLRCANVAGQCSGLASALLAWFAQHGRRDLPWQHPATPYRVWISEIMLQQTRVSTVTPYFERFLQRFPTPSSLAQAPLDEVLRLWSGLGYYSRARHLHQAAQRICALHGGELPSDLEALQTLPGIGRTTAGAIAALDYGLPCPILDGNAKRVLSRYHAVDGWPGEARVAEALWRLAQHHTPAQHARAYTQAIMDLGASLCSRTRPRCADCPLQTDCLACQRGQASQYPAPRPQRALPTRAACFLMLMAGGHHVLLHKRPANGGLWSGLAAFPEYPLAQGSTQPPAWATLQLGWTPAISFNATQCTPHWWPKIQHTFTHFRLEIFPLHLHLEPNAANELLSQPLAAGLFWHDLRQPAGFGAPAPVTRLLARLAGHNP